MGVTKSWDWGRAVTTIAFQKGKYNIYVKRMIVACTPPETRGD